MQLIKPAIDFYFNMQGWEFFYFTCGVLMMGFDIIQMFAYIISKKYRDSLFGMFMELSAWYYSLVVSSLKTTIVGIVLFVITYVITHYTFAWLGWININAILPGIFLFFVVSTVVKGFLITVLFNDDNSGDPVSFN